MSERLDHVAFKHRMLACIKQSRVDIKPFTDMSKAAKRNLNEYDRKHPMSSHDYLGWYYSKCLYIKDGLCDDMYIETIVHEYVHYLRKKSKQFTYRRDKNIFFEEALAEVVAKTVIKQISKPTFRVHHNFVKHICKDVRYQYELNADLTKGFVESLLSESKKMRYKIHIN